MRKQTEVRVIYAENYNIDEKINKLIKEGYELLGAVSAVLLPYNLEIKCYATMIKYEQVEDNKMRTAKDIDYKLKELHLDLQSLGMSWSNGDCNG